MPTTYGGSVGSDIASAVVDGVTLPAGTHVRIPCEAAPLAAWATVLAAQAPAHVGIEATGGLERPVVEALQAARPELGPLNRRQVASLVGVVPVTRDRGTLRGVRTIQGGRAPGRVALYMAALSGRRWNPVVRAHYTPLCARGKRKKVGPHRLHAHTPVHLQPHAPYPHRLAPHQDLTRNTVATVGRVCQFFIGAKHASPASGPTPAGVVGIRSARGTG